MMKLLALALVLLPYGCGGSGGLRVLTHTGSAAQQPPATFQNDPQILIHHCGPPDRNAENAYFQEGSTVAIPSRTLIYGKAHLSITYISAGDGDPNRWAFSGLVDTETNRALSKDDVQRTLRERLPCAVTEPASGKHAGTRSEETRVRNRKSEDRNQTSEGRNQSLEGRRG